MSEFDTGTLRVSAGSYPDRFRSIKTTVGDQATHDMTITFQVQERGEDLAGYFKINVWQGAAQYGAGSTTNTTLAIGSSGVELKELETDNNVIYETDSTGELIITATQSGTKSSRYLRAYLGSEVYPSGVLAFV